MTRDEIYDHLAQVYLGKRKEVDVKKKWQLNAWLVINACITILIFSSVFYGLTAFLTGKKPEFRGNIIFALHSGSIQMSYNFKGDFPPIKTFSLDVPSIDIEKYRSIQFSVRAKEEGTPGILKVILENRLNEKSAYYVKNIDLNWQKVNIPLSEFYEISNLNSLKSISFILESWNAQQKKGLILIEDIRFST